MSSVLEMALEALEATYVDDEGFTEFDWPKRLKAIAALKEAIKNQGEPVAMVKHNGLGFPCVDLLGKNGAQYFGLPDGTKLYTSAPTIPEATFDAAVSAELARVSHIEYDSHEICRYFSSNLRERLFAAPKGEQS